MASSAWLNNFLASLENQNVAASSGSKQMNKQEIAADIIRRSNVHKYSGKDAKNINGGRIKWSRRKTGYKRSI